MKLKHYGKGKENILLLLHGEEASSWIWKDALPYLAQDFHCITMDLPAHGVSSGIEYNTKDIAILITRIFSQILPDRKIYVAGVGIGAQVALTLAYDFSYLIQGVILNSIFMSTKANKVGEKLSFTSFGKSDYYVKKRMKKLGIPLKYFLEFKNDNTVLDSKKIEQVRKAKLAFEADEDPYVLQDIPALILYGQNEDFTYSRSAQLASTYFASNQIVEIPDADHLWMLVRGKTFSQLVKRFVKAHNKKSEYADLL